MRKTPRAVTIVERFKPRSDQAQKRRKTMRQFQVEQAREKKFEPFFRRLRVIAPALSRLFQLSKFGNSRCQVSSRRKNEPFYRVKMLS